MVFPSSPARASQATPVRCISIGVNAFLYAKKRHFCLSPGLYHFSGSAVYIITTKPPYSALFQKTKKPPAYPEEASAAPVLTDRQADKRYECRRHYRHKKHPENESPDVIMIPYFTTISAVVPILKIFLTLASLTSFSPPRTTPITTPFAVAYLIASASMPSLPARRSGPPIR